MTETLDCGCSITFRDDGQVCAIGLCAAHDGLFSENKSFKQLALDLHHQTFQDKTAKLVAAKAAKAEAAAAKAEA